LPETEGRVPGPDYRFTLANERTFLAWERTAIALVGGGLAVLHLLDRDPAVWAMGIVLLSGGLFSGVAGWVRFRTVQRTMEEGGRLSANPGAVVLAIAVVIAALAAFGSLLR
jgi:putative membrane protein